MPRGTSFQSVPGSSTFGAREKRLVAALSSAMGTWWRGVETRIAGACNAAGNLNRRSETSAQGVCHFRGRPQLRGPVSPESLEKKERNNLSLQSRQSPPSPFSVLGLLPGVNHCGKYSALTLSNPSQGVDCMVIAQQWRSDRVGAAGKNARRSLINGQAGFEPRSRARGVDRIIDGTNEAGICKKTGV
jgi:hypothetical protein